MGFDYLDYLYEPVDKKEIVSLLKDNKVISEKSEIYNDLIISLLMVINDNYIGPDWINDDDKKMGHIMWAMKKVFSSFKEEGLEFIETQEFIDYIYDYLSTVFYDRDIEKLGEFDLTKTIFYWNSIFDINKSKSRFEIETFLDVYRIIDELSMF